MRRPLVFPLSACAWPVAISAWFATQALVLCLPVVASEPEAAVGAPRVFVLDVARLRELREGIGRSDASFQSARAHFENSGRLALTAGPFSVVNKDAAPPSGDKHDYLSLAPYWWPNPDTPGGLPYVRRDGERNPEIYKIRNRLDLGDMTDAAETLAIAYYVTGDEDFAAGAAGLLRTWFLDPATRMNPHFQFAQSVRGINTGRGAGLIESRAFARIVDAVGLLAGSQAWTRDDQHGMEAWFAEFLRWMQESEHGHDEAAAKNNHGTYYDVQLASYAFFLGKDELARDVLQAVGKKRIAVQVEPDGRQPLELARTKAWSYSIGNLAGLMALARLGERVDVDLWHFETSDGRSIRRALDFLLPYGLGEEKWQYEQINGFSPDLIYPLLRAAAVKYPDAHYAALAAKLPPPDPASHSKWLLSPLEPIQKLHVP
jgi:Alginate lyase